MGIAEFCGRVTVVINCRLFDHAVRCDACVWHYKYEGDSDGKLKPPLNFPVNYFYEFG